MNQTQQTIKFAGAAAIMLVLATAVHFITKPTPVEGYGRVGELFFPDLDTSEATGLRVVTFNEDTATSKIFSVEKKDGIWRLPTYFGYPADGEDQLAKTSTSLLGIERGALVSRVTTDHERLGVIVPDENMDGALKGRGRRITIMKGEAKLADLIVGKEVPERTGEFYVRKADEDDTYICKLEINLSTKFSDWVEDDLLKMDRDNLVKLEALATVIDPEQGVAQKLEGELSREKSTDDWQLAGLDEETEEVNKDDISTMVNTLDNLKLTGIRRRPRSPIEGVDGPLLLNDLTFNVPEQLLNNPNIDRQLEAAVQADLQDNGFVMFRNPDSKSRRLLSQGGELVAATNEGVEYHLSFGSSFSGTEEEVEFGGSGKKDDDGKDDKKDQTPAGPPSSEEDEDDDDAGLTRSRYLFVRAVFNPAHISPQPVEPTKPIVPEGVNVDKDGNVVEEKAAATNETQDSPTEQTDGDACQDEAEASKDEAANPAAAEGAAAEGEAKAAEAGTAEENAPKPLSPAEIYKKEKAQYDTDLATYERESKEFAEKVEKGKEEVSILNERFADWYYVISEEDFEKLQLTRDKLVKVKEKPETEEGDGQAAPADGAAAPANGATEPADGEKPGEQPASDDKPEGDGKPAAGDSPDADGKPAEPTTPEKTNADDAESNDE